MLKKTLTPEKFLNNYNNEFLQLRRLAINLTDHADDLFFDALNFIYSQLSSLDGQIYKQLKKVMVQLKPVEFLISEEKLLLAFASDHRLAEDHVIFNLINQQISLITTIIADLEYQYAHLYSELILRLKTINHYYNTSKIKICSARKQDELKKILKPTCYIFMARLGALKLNTHAALKIFPIQKDGSIANENVGSHPVNNFNGIHVKIEPDAPLMEFVSHTYNRFFTGEGSTPSFLIKIYHPIAAYPALVSMTVSGQMLHSHLTGNFADFMKKLNPRSFANNVLNSFPTYPEDAKAENLIAKEIKNGEQVNLYDLVNIDQDQVFSNAFYESHGEHYVNSKSVLYFFPTMSSNLPLEVRSQIAQHDVVELLFDCLEVYLTRNEEAQELIRTRVITPDEKETLKLTIRFVPGTIKRLYKSSNALIQLCRSQQKEISLNDCFSTVDPLLAQVYQLYRLWAELFYSDCKQKIYALINNRQLHELSVEEKNSVYKLLDEYRLLKKRGEEEKTLMLLLEEPENNIESSPYVILLAYSFLTSTSVEQLIKLIPIEKIPPHIDTQKILAEISAYKAKSGDFETKRTQTIEKAFEELIGELDFSIASADKQEQWLRRIIVRSLSSLVLQSSSILNDEHIHQLAKNNHNLQELQILHCSNVTENCLAQLALFHPELRLTISQSEYMGKSSWPELGSDFAEFSLVLLDGFKITLKRGQKLSQKIGLLHSAVKQKSTLGIAYLLANNVDINQFDEEGHTPLYYAVQAKDIEIINLLLARKARVHFAENDVNPIVHMAIRTKQTEIVELLLAHTELMIIDANKQTLLHAAAECSTFEFFSSLIKKLSPKQMTQHFLSVDSKSRSLLHAAAINPDAGVLDYLLKHIEHSVQDDMGYTPLHLAARLGLNENITALLQAGADPLVRTPGGVLPIDLARKYHHYVVVTSLSLQAFKPNMGNAVIVAPRPILAVDVRGNTPFHKAIFDGDIDRLLELLKNYQDFPINLSNYDGRTLLHLLAQGPDKHLNTYESDDAETLKYIEKFIQALEEVIKRGANIEMEDKWGDTPLLLAVRDSHSTLIVGWLLKHGASLDTQTRDKQTVLHIAAGEQKKQLIMMDYLLSNGASFLLNKEDADGYTPLALLIKKKPTYIGQKETFLYLLKQKELNSNLVSNELRTLLHLAAERDESIFLLELLPKSEKINWQDLEGNTALHIAIQLTNNANQSERKIMIRALLQAGADKELKNNNGQSSADLAEKIPELENILSSNKSPASYFYNFFSPKHTSLENNKNEDLHIYSELLEMAYSNLKFSLLLGELAISLLSRNEVKQCQELYHRYKGVFLSVLGDSNSQANLTFSNETLAQDIKSAKFVVEKTNQKIKQLQSHQKILLENPMPHNWAKSACYEVEIKTLKIYAEFQKQVLYRISMMVRLPHLQEKARSIIEKHGRNISKSADLRINEEREQAQSLSSAENIKQNYRWLLAKLYTILINEQLRAIYYQVERSVMDELVKSIELEMEGVVLKRNFAMDNKQFKLYELQLELWFERWKNMSEKSSVKLLVAPASTLQTPKASRENELILTNSSYAGRVEKVKEEFLRFIQKVFEGPQKLQLKEAGETITFYVALGSDQSVGLRESFIALQTYINENFKEWVKTSKISNREIIIEAVSKAYAENISNLFRHVLSVTANPIKLDDSNIAKKM